MNRVENIKGCILTDIGQFKEFKVSGLLLPKDEVSRNGVLYDWDSAKEKAKQFEGVPMNYNHIIDDDKPPVGKITKIEVKEEADENGPAGLYYEADIDEDSEYASSIQKGFLNKVSLQVTADAQKEEESADGKTYTRAWIKDPLEVSVVKVPGFNQTTMEVAIAEAFKEADELRQHAKSSVDISVDKIGVKATKKAIEDNKFIPASAKKAMLDYIKQKYKEAKPVFGRGIESFEDGEEEGLKPKKGLKSKGAHKEVVDPLPEDEVDPKELEMGIEVEMEHTDDREEAKKIALQHLAEVPDYYTKLGKYVEEEGMDTGNIPSKVKMVDKKKEAYSLKTRKVGEVTVIEVIDDKGRIVNRYRLSDKGNGLIVHESFNEKFKIGQKVKTPKGDIGTVRQYIDNTNVVVELDYPKSGKQEWEDSALKKESFKEIKDSKGKPILGGAKVKTSDGKIGYVYQITDDEIRVTKTKQTGLIGWYKPEELTVKEFKVIDAIEILTEEEAKEFNENFTMDDLRKVATDDTLRVALGLSMTATTKQIEDKVKSLTPQDRKKVAQYFGLRESFKEAILTIPDMYERKIKLLNIKYTKGANNVLYVSDTYKDDLKKANIKYFESFSETMGMNSAMLRAIDNVLQKKYPEIHVQLFKDIVFATSNIQRESFEELTVKDKKKEAITIDQLKKVATVDSMRVGLGLSMTATENDIKKKLASLSPQDEKKVKQYFGLKESFSEAKDSKGKPILGGAKVKTKDGKTGYVYQIMDDEIRVTKTKQTGLIGWYKPEELTVKEFKVVDIIEILTDEEAKELVEYFRESKSYPGLILVDNKYLSKLKSNGIKYEDTGSGQWVAVDVKYSKQLSKLGIPNKESFSEAKINNYF